MRRVCTVWRIDYSRSPLRFSRRHTLPRRVADLSAFSSVAALLSATEKRKWLPRTHLARHAHSQIGKDVNSEKQLGLAGDFSNSVADKPGPLKVLVVDDSAIVRQVLLAVLSEKRGFQVIVAADPLIAMDKMKKFTPNVILLDLEMPRMDGMTFLEKLISEHPVPVVVCSGMTGPRTEAAIRALEIGAVDVITKPKIGIRGFLEESAVLLEDTVRAAATARISKFRKFRAPYRKNQSAGILIPPVTIPASTQRCEKIVAIGASTGG